METNLSNRLQATLLALMTVGLMLLAGWNLMQETELRNQQPDDGVWWSEVAGGTGLIADKVLPGGPGERYGLKANDLLTEVNDVPVHRLADQVRELYRTGVYGNARYSITRDGIKLDAPIVVIP